MSTLEALKATGTLVVADSGEIDKLKALHPQDATTNPSLINAAARLPEYGHLVDDAVAYGKKSGLEGKALLDLTMDKIAVNFGSEILKHVPGYISTELDARLSFDSKANVDRARRILALYDEAGVPRDRILIKIATTWEGIQAAKVLEADGVRCNMTLLFNFAQAVTAAEAGATLISPFVGRILDHYKKATGKTEVPPTEDPGVLSVAKIYNHYKAHGYKTIVMGASFRNVGEIVALAGCDRLTISPALLEKLAGMTDPVPRALAPGEKVSEEAYAKRITYDEASFRWAMNEDPMATEKLAEGVRGFAADLVKLEDYVKPMLGM